MKEVENSQLNNLDFFLSGIPCHWQMNIKLSSIARNERGSFTNGPFGSDLLTSELQDTGVPVIYIRDIRNGVYQRVSDVCVTLQKAKQLNVCNVSEGDILVAKVGDPPGISAVYPQNEPNAIITQDVIRIKTQSRIVNNAFLVLLLNSQFGKYIIDQITVESTRSRISLGDFKRTNIYLPPLFEQIAIANYLDLKISTIDRKVVLLEQKITHYQQLRKSLINETVCRGLDKNVKLKNSGIEWIGQIPEIWEVKRIKDLTEVKRGASPRPIDDPIFFDDNGEFAWVRISDLTASERYLEVTKEKLSILGASLSVKRYPSDFILSIAGTVGKPIITKIKCCIHDGFVWFPSLKIDCEYLYYIFSTGLPYQGLGKLGTQLNLNTETVGLISIPLPSKSEIIEIISYLDEKTQKIDSIVSNIKLQIETLKELRKTLINDVVTGKINVTA